jgi:glycosyltransferase involved in cell wall biosynthesis
VGLFLHSLFYRGLFDFLLVTGLLGLIALKVYTLIIKQETYYRDFSIDEKSIIGNPLRIAMFTDRYLPFLGGVPLSIQRLYLSLKAQGSLVKIFAPSYGEDGDKENGDIFRCPSLLPGAGGRSPVANIFSGKIKEAFRDFNCDIVHLHHPLWLGRKGMRLARQHGLPVVFTYHTRLERYTHNLPIPGKLFKELGAHYLIRKFANRCQAIITPTTSTEEYLRNLGVSSLVETIPTGIDLGQYEAWKESDVKQFRDKYAPDGALLISVSRMSLEKNLDFLIEGLRKVMSRVDDPVYCLLVGGGPEQERLETKVEKFGLSNRIFFAGETTPAEVVRSYLAADLFVFASTSETQGMVLLEAMAGGCPVVAVNASGVYDVVEDGYNGYKVPESTQSWADAVTDLLGDMEHLRTLSANSREYALKYSEDRIAEKVLNLYARVLVLHRSEKPDRKGT